MEYILQIIVGVIIVAIVGIFIRFFFRKKTKSKPATSDNISAPITIHNVSDPVKIHKEKPEEATKNPKLFISYAWTDDKHKQWVKGLAKRLRDSGVKPEFDEWGLRIGHDINAYMEGMVTDPTITKVIMVVDKNYAKKADDREGGVGTEASIIAKEINKDKEQKKFAAIALEKDAKGNLIFPVYWGSRRGIDFSDYNDHDSDHKSYNELLYWIFDKPLHEKPALGKIPDFISGKTIISVPVLWTDREICRAAVNTYFSLKDMPVDSEDNGDFMGFESAAGYIYTCRLEDNIAILKWVNGTDDAMTSKATSFELNGNTLVVIDNSTGSTKTFTKGKRPFNWFSH